MGFLCENVVITGPGNGLEVDRDTWCALLNMGIFVDRGAHGQPLLGEEWKTGFMLSALDDEKLPVTLSAGQARAVADSLETYSALIPDPEEIGEVLTDTSTPVDGLYEKFAVTKRRGWVQTDDVSLVFLEEGKGIIRDVIELCRRGPVKVDLARRAEPNRRLTLVKTRPSAKGIDRAS